MVVLFVIKNMISAGIIKSLAKIRIIPRIIYLNVPVIKATNKWNTKPSRRLFIFDINKLDFLIDTGAAVSVIPVSIGYTSSTIKTFGTSSLTIDLGLNHKYKFTFILADVNHSILGADFFNVSTLL